MTEAADSTSYRLIPELYQDHWFNTWKVRPEGSSSEYRPVYARALPAPSDVTFELPIFKK